MSVWWKNTESCKGKRDCEEIVIADWGVGQSCDGFSGGKFLKHFGFLIPLRQLNGL